VTCRFAHDDGAYVLGALSPSERLAFEQHLPECADCTRAVRELAGLPGLLGRVDPRVLEEPRVVDPVPDTLLPALARQVRRSRRRRTFVAGGLAAAAVAAAVVVPVLGVRGGADDTATPPPAASSTGSPALAMQPVGDVPLRASLSLERTGSGTRVGLTCTYDPDRVGYALPPAVDYTLVVRTRDGRAEQLGSWRSVSYEPMRFSAVTAATLRSIASVEVRAPGGRVVLRHAA